MLRPSVGAVATCNRLAIASLAINFVLIIAVLRSRTAEPKRSHTAASSTAPHAATNDGGAVAAAEERRRHAEGRLQSAQAAVAGLSEYADWLNAILPRHKLFFAESDTDKPLTDDLPIAVTESLPPQHSSPVRDGACGSHPLALVCQRMHIVTIRSSPDERFDWLQSPPHAHTPRTIYDHTNPFSSHFLSPNAGAEAHALLRFIIDNYHSLPAVVTLLHSDPTAHNPHIHRYVAALRLPPAGEAAGADAIRYTPLNVDPSKEQYLIRRLSDKNSADWSTEIGVWRQFLIAIDPAAGATLIPPLPADETITAYCCAQFAVSRDTIRRLPLAFYRFVYRRMMHQSVVWRSTRAFGALLEHAWHALFTGEWQTPRYADSPTLQSLYCRSFIDSCPLTTN